MSDDLIHDLDSELPAPRDDEPASLRQDILDELSDHLQCATRREQLRDGASSTKTIQRRVLDKFGSPAAVARQLWFDWMWEKIAMQRLSIALMITVVLCCGAMLFFTWQTTQNTQAALLASQQTQLEMLKQLENFAKQPAVAPVQAQPAEWNNLKIKLVYDDEARTPVEGAEVYINGISDNNTQLKNISENTDASGTVDIGTVLYGEYNLSIKLPNRLTNNSNEVVAVRPGQDMLKEVVCPRSATLPVDVKVVLPEYFRDTSQTHENANWFQVKCSSTGQIFDASGGFVDSGGLSGEYFPWYYGVYYTELQKDHSVTFWISDQGIHADIVLEAIDNDTENPLPVELSKFPAECFEIKDPGQSRQTVDLMRGVQTVNSVKMFVQRESADGTTYLVGVPEIPLTTVGQSVDSQQGMYASEMGMGDMSGNNAMERVSSFNLMDGYGGGEELSHATQKYMQLFSLFPLDHTMVGHRSRNFSVGSSRNDGSQLNLSLPVNQYEPLMFWLASQLKADQQLVTFFGTSDASFKLGFETQSVDLFEVNEQKPVGTFDCLFAQHYNGGVGAYGESANENRDEQVFEWKYLIAATLQQKEKLDEVYQESLEEVIPQSKLFLVKPSEPGSNPAKTAEESGTTSE